MENVCPRQREEFDHAKRAEELQSSRGSVSCQPCAHRPEQPLGAPHRIPLVAFREEARCYVLKAELPRVKPEDVKITLADGTLTITGDRTFDLNRKQDGPAEHAYGRFAHSFEVPADARPAKVKAVFKNGILTVHLAKSACALFASRRDVAFPTLRLNRRDQLHELEHEARL